MIDFTITPTSNPLSYTVGGNTYPYSKQADGISRPSDIRYQVFAIPIGIELTLASTVTVPPGLSAIEYRWDFGDGTIGYGPTVVHTYKVAAADTAATLVVTDSKLNKQSRSKILNLRPASRIVISPTTIMAS